MSDSARDRSKLYSLEIREKRRNSQRATDGRDDGYEVDIVNGWQLHLARFCKSISQYLMQIKADKAQESFRPQSNAFDGIDDIVLLAVQVVAKDVRKKEEIGSTGAKPGQFMVASEIEAKSHQLPSDFRPKARCSEQARCSRSFGGGWWIHR